MLNIFFYVEAIYDNKTVPEALAPNNAKGFSANRANINETRQQ